MQSKWREAIQSMAPDAPQPGMGMGNVPHAPGIMSGQFGAEQLFGNLSRMNGMQQARQQMAQATATPSASMPSPSPVGNMPMQWTPEVQQQIMQYLMSVLRSTRPGDRMTTTGGTVRGSNGGSV